MKAARFQSSQGDGLHRGWASFLLDVILTEYQMQLTLDGIIF